MYLKKSPRSQRQPPARKLRTGALSLPSQRTPRRPIMPLRDWFTPESGCCSITRTTPRQQASTAPKQHSICCRNFQWLFCPCHMISMMMEMIEDIIREEDQEEALREEDVEPIREREEMRESEDQEEDIEKEVLTDVVIAMEDEESRMEEEEEGRTGIRVVALLVEMAPPVVSTAAIAPTSIPISMYSSTLRTRRRWRRSTRRLRGA